MADETEDEQVEVGEPVEDPTDLQEPPSLRPGTVLAVIKRKGLIGAMKDEAMGPHMHLLAILGVVVLIAISVGALSLATG